MKGLLIAQATRAGQSVGRLSRPVDGVLTIGSGRDCDLVLPDPTVAEQHVFVVPAPAGFRLMAHADTAFVAEGRPVRTFDVTGRVEIEIGPFSIVLRPLEQAVARHERADATRAGEDTRTHEGRNIQDGMPTHGDAESLRTLQVEVDPDATLMTGDLGVALAATIAQMTDGADATVQMKAPRAPIPRSRLARAAHAREPRPDPDAEATRVARRSSARPLPRAQPNREASADPAVPRETTLLLDDADLVIDEPTLSVAAPPPAPRAAPKGIEPGRPAGPPRPPPAPPTAAPPSSAGPAPAPTAARPPPAPSLPTDPAAPDAPDPDPPLVVSDADFERLLAEQDHRPARFVRPSPALRRGLSRYLFDHDGDARGRLGALVTGSLALHCFVLLIAGHAPAPSPATIDRLDDRYVQVLWVPPPLIPPGASEKDPADTKEPDPATPPPKPPEEPPPSPPVVVIEPVPVPDEPHEATAREAVKRIEKTRQEIDAADSSRAIDRLATRLGAGGEGPLGGDDGTSRVSAGGGGRAGGPSLAPGGFGGSEQTLTAAVDERSRTKPRLDLAHEKGRGGKPSAQKTFTGGARDGVLSRQAIQAVFDGKKRLIDFCFARHAQGKQLRLDVVATIGADGRFLTEGLSITGASDGAGEAVADCIRKVYRRMKFAAPGGRVEIRRTHVFHGSEDG